MSNEPLSSAGRRIAGGLAILGWASLGLQFGLDLSSGRGGASAVAHIVWNMAGYFTILTNALMASAMTAIAVSPKTPPPNRVAGIALYALMLTALYQVVLGGTHGQAGLRLVVDLGHHYVLPLLVFAFWLGFAPKCRLKASDPFLWLCYPVGYFAYAVIRGKSSGHYPYDIIDLSRHPTSEVLVSFGLLTAAFLGVGFILVGLSRVLVGAKPEPAR